MIEHLSYSSISSYLTCPRAWRYHYLDKIETATAPALVFGSAFHGAIEEHVKTVDATDRALLTERWQRHWNQQLERNPKIEWGNDSPESLCNDGIRMLSDPDVVALIGGLHPLDEPNSVERFVELRVPNVPIPVIGYIDMIEADGIPCDFKTSKASWNQQKAEAEMQPVFYLAALNQAGYSLNPELRFRHYVFVKTKKPQAQVWETQRQPGELFWLFGVIQDVYRGIEREVFPPNPGAWKCSAKWCEYWSICRGRSL